LLDVPASPVAGRELSARSSAPGAGGSAAYPSTTRWRRRCGGTAPTPRWYLRRLSSLTYHALDAALEEGTPFW